MKEKVNAHFLLLCTFTQCLFFILCMMCFSQRSCCCFPSTGPCIPYKYPSISTILNSPAKKTKKCGWNYQVHFDNDSSELNKIKKKKKKKNFFRQIENLFSKTSHRPHNYSKLFYRTNSLSTKENMLCVL